MKQADNPLFTRTLTLTSERAQDKPATILSDWLSDEEYLYSYLVKCKVTNEVVEMYIIDATVSQVAKYNTIPVPEAILGMVETLNSKSMEFVIGYQQPPLEVMVEAFTPFVQSLARKMSAQWNQEYDDMVQTCYLCMCTLYNKGYYLHKSLLTSTFVHAVLASLRKIHTATRNGYRGTISLYSTVSGDDKLTYESVIKDERQEQMLEELEDNDEKEYLTNRKRAMAIDFMGERKYKSLLASIETGTTTQIERSLMYRAGKKLKSKNKGE